MQLFGCNPKSSPQWHNTLICLSHWSSGLYPTNRLGSLLSSYFKGSKVWKIKRLFFMLWKRVSSRLKSWLHTVRAIYFLKKTDTKLRFVVPNHCHSYTFSIEALNEYPLEQKYWNATQHTFTLAVCRCPTNPYDLCHTMCSSHTGWMPECLWGMLISVQITWNHCISDLFF